MGYRKKVTKKQEFTGTRVEVRNNKIEFAIKTLIQIMDELDNSDLNKRPTTNKTSIGELLEHLTNICEADLMIGNSVPEREMKHYYSSVSYNSLDEMKIAIKRNFLQLKKHYLSLSGLDLTEKVTSYWGVSYTRYEWLLEILAHLYHHRGQLHAMLVHCCNKELKVSLFE